QSQGSEGFVDRILSESASAGPLPAVAPRLSTDCLSDSRSFLLVTLLLGLGRWRQHIQRTLLIVEAQDEIQERGRIKLFHLLPSALVTEVRKLNCQTIDKREEGSQIRFGHRIHCSLPC